MLRVLVVGPRDLLLITREKTVFDLLFTYLYLRNPNLMKISFCTINPKLVLFCGSVHQVMRDEVQHHLVQMYSYTC